MNSGNSKRATSNTEALKYSNINSETRNIITLKGFNLKYYKSK